MPIRMLSVGVTGLSLDGSQQLDLFMDTAKAEKAQRLDEAVDSIRAKYGKQSITFGRTMDT